jgi:hypothetical protein
MFMVHRRNEARKPATDRSTPVRDLGGFVIPVDRPPFRIGQLHRHVGLGVASFNGATPMMAWKTSGSKGSVMKTSSLQWGYADDGVENA